MKHQGNPFKCAACKAEAARIAHRFHPDSDVGPMDDACVECGHLHEPHDLRKECPLRASLTER